MCRLDSLPLYVTYCVLQFRKEHNLWFHNDLICPEYHGQQYHRLLKNQGKHQHHIHLFNCLYNFIYEWKQHQRGRWFFRNPYWFSGKILNASRKVETRLCIIFTNILWKNTQHTDRSVIIKQRGVITYVHENDICNFQSTRENCLGKRQIAGVGQWLNQNFQG